jgi:uncharacterized protein
MLASCRDQVAGSQRAQLDYVQDEANILPEIFETKLSARLAKFEQDTKHQMVVATTNELRGQPIESFSLAMAKRLEIGRRNVDDGLMFLIAPNDRKARIEVGLGLEAALTNVEAKQIMETAIIPAFRRGDFQAGINDGVSAIIHETP